MSPAFQGRGGVLAGVVFALPGGIGPLLRSACGRLGAAVGQFLSALLMKIGGLRFSPHRVG